MRRCRSAKNAVMREEFDLSLSEIDALFDGATELAKREIGLTQRGPVFEAAPSAATISELLSAERELPLEGEPIESLLASCASLLAHGRRTGPTFFGYVLSPAAPVGVAADLIASATNQNVTSWRSAPGATELEHISIRWLGQFVGFADDAQGILLSGGSAANLTALWCALRAGTTPEADRHSLVVYASSEAHFSVSKAASVLGVAVNTVGDERLDPSALGEAITADRANDRQPFCVVATAGTTATGAVDPLEEIARVAGTHGLWLHVDGAYGGPAAAVLAQSHLFAGIDLADSLCIDAHKWLYAPLDCGALLLKPGSRPPFSPSDDHGDYVRVLSTEQAAEDFAFWDHGLELSRRFRALKLWMIFRYYGARRLAASIAEDIAMAHYMAELVGESHELELLAGPSLSICCFRHRPPGLTTEQLDGHNERLLKALQRDGSVYLSNANVGGRFALRACITNFRTTRHDIDRAIEVVQTLGRQVLEDRPRI
jgi:aromatic-L-amino-acid/L-tryptophan decarboxylase